MYQTGPKVTKGKMFHLTDVLTKLWVTNGNKTTKQDTKVYSMTLQ